MAQQGFEYEKSVYRELKKYKIVTGSPPAGAASNRPDLIIQDPKTKKTAGCELKNGTASGGSLVLKYYDGQWHLGDTEGKEEKEFLANLAKKLNILNEMNNGKWKDKVPHLQNDPKNARRKIIVGAKDIREARQKDLQQFGAQNEIRIRIPGKVMCDYYIIKRNSYLNVGSHGFYTLNNKDALNLNDKLKKLKYKPIPNFARTAKLLLRVRSMYKGGDAYQFSMDLSFTSVDKSEYNIGPLKTGSTSNVDPNQLKQNPILLAFT